MSKTTYRTECWGQRYAVRADWAQASDPVEVRYEDEDWSLDECGRQVADFRHRPESAMRAWLLAGEDADDPDILADVGAAAEAMVESES